MSSISDGLRLLTIVALLAALDKQTNELDVESGPPPTAVDIIPNARMQTGQLQPVNTAEATSTQVNLTVILLDLCSVAS